MASNQVDRYTGRQVDRYTGIQVGRLPVYLRTCLRIYLFPCLLVFLLTACVTLQDPEAAQEHAEATIGSVGNGQTIGQSFVSPRPRLNGITLWLALAPETSPVSGSLTVELYHTPQDALPIFVTEVPYSRIASNGATAISLPPQPDPPGQGYILVLRTTGGVVRVLGRAEDAYPDGQAYLGPNPMQADLAFRLTYDYDARAMLGDLWDALPGLWLILPLGMVLFLPGWLLLDLTGLRRRFDGGEQVALSVGLSLAVIPLAMLWTTTLGLVWNREGALFGWGVLAALAVWRVGSRLLQPRLTTTPENGILRGVDPEPVEILRSAQNDKRRAQNDNWNLHSLALIAIFVFSLALRLAMARDLSAPAWVDSVHHAAITRLVVEQGRIPETYAPSLNIPAISYHPGFHVVLAAFHWLSGLDIPEAMLLLGQVLNALVVFAAYLLATTLTRNRTAGVVAALVAGFVTPMPAYYTSWGRYTQLAGLLILPVVLALAAMSLRGAYSATKQSPLIQGDCFAKDARSDTPKTSFLRTVFALQRNSSPQSLTTHPSTTLRMHPERSRRMFLATTGLAGIASAGLFIVHYRVAVFAACLLLAWLIGQIPFDRRELWRFARRAMGYGLAIGLGAALLALPWLWEAVARLLLPVLGQPPGGEVKAFGDFSWRYLNAGLGLYALGAAGAGAVWGIIRRRRFVLALALWVGLLFLLANLGALGLPGGSAFNNTTVTISLFLPIAVLAGFLVGDVADMLRKALSPPWQRLAYTLLALAAVTVAIFGVRALLPILNPSTALFRRADRAAMTWVEQNIPQDETIVINPFLWGYGLYGGADGGFWITPLTGRKTIPPPVLYGLGPAEERQRANAISQEVTAMGSDPARLWEYLRSQGIGYVFVGQRGGAISPQALSQSPLFERLYAQDGVWVFKLLPERP